MPTDLLLWECPPLRARVSVEQCHRNQDRATGKRGKRAAIGKKLVHQLDHILFAPCLGCPGVVKLREQGETETPRSVGAHAG